MTQFVQSAAALVQTDDALATTQDLIADAVAACATARATKRALQAPAVQYLRAIREAGRLLSLVQRSDGGRPLKNSSSGLTSYQFAMKQSGISRQTANLWRRVAEIPGEDFEQFIVETALAGRDLTVAELLRTCSPKSQTAPKMRTVTLTLSENEYCAFEQAVGVLGAILFTNTATQTVMTILGHAYSAWLAAQSQRSRPYADDVARVA